jgi:16S rRNA (cytosine1402-N4)-methyltransferase
MIRAMPHDTEHIPVLLHEVLGALNLAPGKNYIDGTLGLGGHTEAILEATAPNGIVLGFDRDAAAIDKARVRLERFGDRLIITHSSYAEMARAALEHGIDQVDGILLDLGYSSMQIDDPTRGFSFREGGPLDMRFDSAQGLTADELVNRTSAEELADIIYQYGEDRNSRRIARAILAARPIRDTAHLAAVVAKASPSKEKIHPATRTFQALRIAVNDELGQLERALPQTLDLLRPGGRLAVISFHSLEDRIVKQYMKLEATDCICPPEQLICTCDHHASLRLVSRKPIEAGDAEVAANPRARSAKLRVGERL